MKRNKIFYFLAVLGSEKRSNIKQYMRYLTLAILLVSIAAHASEQSTGYHRVVQGDTLWSISERYYGTPSEWPFLQQLNTVSDPAHLQPGAMVDLGVVDSFPLTVLYLSGTAWKIDNDTRTLLASGQTLEAGTTLQTGAGTTLTLQMSDGVRAVIPSMSRITLNRVEGKGITLLLEEGEVESYVPTKRLKQNPYNIETSNGVLSVRGTHFQAGYGQDELLASVYSGNVASQNQSISEQVLVNASEGVRIGGDGSIQTASLLPPPEIGTISSFATGEIQINIEPTSGATQNRARLASDPEFLNILRDKRFEGTQLRFSTLPPGFYHLRISAIDGLGIEGNSSAYLIHHHTEQVTVHSEGEAWVFDWLHRAQKSYYLELAADNQFSRILHTHTSQSNNPLRVSRLPQGEIYWRIISRDNNNNTNAIIGNGVLNAAGN